MTLGHSLGEFAAVVAGGYLDYTDSLRIIRRRAEAMKACTQNAISATSDSTGDGGPPPEYGMVALVCEPDRLAPLLATVEEFLGHAGRPPPGLLAAEEQDGQDGPTTAAFRMVSIANVNSKNQIVLSGDLERVRALLVQLRQFGGHDPRAVRLNSDSPFHSPIMLPAKAVMARLMADARVRFPGRFPCVSNVLGRPVRGADDLRDVLTRQCVETVRWWDSIKYVDQEMGVRRWIGLGPGKVGRNLVGKEVGMRGHDVVRGGGVWGISKPDEVEDFLRGFEKTERVGEGAT